MGDYMLDQDYVENQAIDAEENKYERNGRGREEKLILRVPCFAWIASARPKGIENTHLALDNLNFPIVIFWIEPANPKNQRSNHRKIYYGFFEEKNVPLRTNVAAGIRRATEVAGNIGFNVFGTNTYVYVYPVPNTYIETPLSNGAGGRNNNNNNNINNFNIPEFLKGKNLYNNYETTCIIPPYVSAVNVDLDFQGIPQAQIEATKQALNQIINTPEGKRAQQKFYRNMIIDVCSSGKDNTNVEMNDNTSSHCSTKAVKYPMSDPESANLLQFANNVGWGLHVFFQYIHDNTLQNFQDAGRAGEFDDETYDLLKSLEQLMLGEWGFGWDAGSKRLIYPPNWKDRVHDLQWAGRPIPGLRNPDVYWDDITGTVPNANVQANANAQGNANPNANPNANVNGRERVRSFVQQP